MKGLVLTILVLGDREQNPLQYNKSKSFVHDTHLNKIYLQGVGKGKQTKWPQKAQVKIVEFL